MKKVLIIDDESSIREILEELFKSDYGFDSITSCEDALDAHIQCQNEKFDVICLDHNMPYIKGADFLVALRQKKSINQHTPVLFVSAYLPNLSDEQKSIANTYFIEKPIDFERLGRYVKMSILK